MSASRVAVCLVALLLSAPAAGQKKAKAPAGAKVAETEIGLEARDDARQLAEDYLKAISHEGDDKAIEALLGGATLTARIFTLENWKIVGREKHRREEGEVADLQTQVKAVDKAGGSALSDVMDAPEDPDGLAMTELTADQAAKLLEPTRAKARQFAKQHPVFAYIARVDKQVYWHPQNPFRKLLADAGAKGKYTAEIDLFWVETVEGTTDTYARKWPLRVVRFQANGKDTGLKILPASDWNAE